MRFLSGWMSAFGIILAIQSPACAQSAAAPVVPPAWPVTSAPARFTIAEDNDAKPNAVSSVSLCLPDPQWAAMPIRIFTDAGTAVGSDLLWTAPGEPTTLLFDSSSGAKRYDVYLGSNWPPLHLADAKAAVLLESRAGDGTAIDNLAGMFQAWNQSTTINGRAIVPGIFEGGNRFGPEGNSLERFQGWFDVASPEHLELAVISNDAAFVLVDGKEVVEWPGHHDFPGGLAGQHQGAVDLQPGLHLLEYYNAYMAEPGNRPILCCLAAKGGPLAGWTMLTPNVPFFRPMSHAHVVSYELQTNPPQGRVPAFAIAWSTIGQCVIDPNIPDIGLISVQLTCLPATTGTVTWTLDDGSTATGPSVTHLFPRPGMRLVQASATDAGKNLGTLRQTISIHPNWTLLTTSRPELIPAYQADITGRDPAILPVSDLAGCVAVFETFKDTESLLKILPAVCAKIKAIPDADLPYITDAALFLADDWAHSAEAIQLLRAVVDRCPQSSPPQMAGCGEARLALARLVLTTTNHTDEVRSILDATDPRTLTGEERYQLAILRADLALATGDIAGARIQYEARTHEPIGPDARSSVRRTAQIGQARAFLERKDFDAAEKSLSDVVRAAPIEKMSPDWELTRLRLYQEENLPAVAYLWATRLLPVITGEGRSELLFRLADLAFAQGDTEVGRRTLSELLTKHPYSQEAAQAKEKWPGQE